jgi:hypothetical protein
VALRFLGTTLVLIGLTHGTDVRAECAAVYTTGQMAADLGTMTTSLRSLDEEVFLRAGQLLNTGLVCMETTLPASAYASAFRYIGTFHFLEGRLDEAGGWYRTALELDPTFEWDINDLPIDNPIRIEFEKERSRAVVEPVRIEGKILAPPEGAYLLLDGRKIRYAEATVGRPHLLQVVTGGAVTEAEVIDGNAIPDEYLMIGDDGGSADKAGPGREVVTVLRIRPPLKTPMLVIGSVGVAAGIGLYVGSMVTHAKFQKATTTSEVLRLQGVTNSLVIASSACLLVGVGTGYAGIILDGAPGFWYTKRF